MPSFGTNSKRRLATCDPEIQEVLNEAINHFDFSVIWGHRGKFHQNRVFREGNSKVQWPNSRHNTSPSRAVDIVPYPGGFANEDEAFYKMATYIFRVAGDKGVHLSWGGHWRSFKDLAHFELDKEVK